MSRPHGFAQILFITWSRVRLLMRSPTRMKSPDTLRKSARMWLKWEHSSLVRDLLRINLHLPRKKYISTNICTNIQPTHKQNVMYHFLWNRHIYETGKSWNIYMISWYKSLQMSEEADKNNMHSMMFDKNKGYACLNTGPA